LYDELATMGGCNPVTVVYCPDRMGNLCFFPPDKREHLTGKRLSLWPEKRIGMTGKIGYFLFALLVLTTGTLCRQQLPVQYASGGDSVGSLTQHVPPQEKSGLHYFHHSFIASETVSEVIAPMLHINCRQLASATPSLRPSEKSPLPCSNRPANPHPDAVDYYVFSLGKIRI
jgi:hypothetical protein